MTRADRGCVLALPSLIIIPTAHPPAPRCQQCAPGASARTALTQRPACFWQTPRRVTRHCSRSRASRGQLRQPVLDAPSLLAGGAGARLSHAEEPRGPHMRACFCLICGWRYKAWPASGRVRQGVCGERSSPTTLFPLKIVLTLGVRLAWLSCSAVGPSEGARGPHTRACASRNQRLSWPWASPRPDHPATSAEAGKPAAPRPVPGSTRSGAHAVPVPPAQLTVARLPPSLPGSPG